MFRARIAGPFGEYLEPFGVADAVFHPDPKTAQAAIVLLFLVGPFAALRLFVGRIEMAVVIAISLIAAIRVELRGLW